MTATGNDEFRASFFEECEELLEAMHDGLGLMQSADADEETVHVIFRAVHSIKGGSGAFGLDDLVAFAHHFETALDSLRAGKIEADPDILTLFQQCGDYLSDLVGAARDGIAADPAPVIALGGRLDAVIGPPDEAGDDVNDAAEAFVPMALDLGGLGAGVPTALPPLGEQRLLQDPRGTGSILRLSLSCFRAAMNRRCCFLLSIRSARFASQRFCRMFQA